MVRLAKRLKSIRSALLNLVELGPGTRQAGLISGYISTHQQHTSATSYDAKNKANQKTMELIKTFSVKEHSDP